jgi:hypothetical protein
MIVKEREVPVELQVLRCLKNRMVFTEKEKIYHINLEKGYAGEIMFDDLIKNSPNDCLIVNDITLEVSNNVFQIDSLMIFKDMICVFEVKNYEDNFYFESNKWYSLPSRMEINNPILQIDRSETLLRKYLHIHRFPIPIESKIVFVNPTFTLYQAPMDLPLVFPTQLKHLQSTLESKKGVLTAQHTKLAKQMCNDHIVTSRYLRLPNYSYESLKKGMVCRSCGELYTNWGESILHCKSCRNNETIALAFIRSVKEFKLLFHRRKITSREIFEWCSIIPSQKATRYLLNKYFKPIGQGRSKSYE